MKIAFPNVNNNIHFGIQNGMLAKNDYNNYLNPQKEEISLSDNSSLKPMSLLKHEIVANRQKMLAPIKTKEEYDELYKATLDTNNHVDLELSKMNEAQREVSMVFARKIENADPELIEKLRKALEEK